MIEICKMTLTFESVNKILWCDLSNETSFVLSTLTSCYLFLQNFTKRNLILLVILFSFSFDFVPLTVKG